MKSLWLIGRLTGHASYKGRLFLITLGVSPPISLKIRGSLCLPHNIQLLIIWKRLLGISRRFHSVLKSAEEHRRIFPEPPLISFMRCKNLKDILVRARLSNEEIEGNNNRGYFRCGKSRCQVCEVMCNCDKFHSKTNSTEYRINCALNCDSPNVAYLLECTVCGVQ